MLPLLMLTLLPHHRIAWELRCKTTKKRNKRKDFHTLSEHYKFPFLLLEPELEDVS